MEISVVMPLYNRERYIADSLRSVLTQTVLPYEVIIIDDGSTDSSVSCAMQLAADLNYTDIKLISRENKGSNTSRNEGLLAASGDLVQFMDSDDQLHPRKFELQLQPFLQEPDIDVVFSPYGIISNRYVYPSTSDNFDDLFRFQLAGEPPAMNTISGMYRRDFLMENNLFWNEEIRIWQDWELNVRVFLASKNIKKVDETLSFVGIYTDGSITSTRTSHVGLTRQLTSVNAVIAVLQSAGRFGCEEKGILCRRYRDIAIRAAEAKEHVLADESLELLKKTHFWNRHYLLAHLLSRKALPSRLLLQTAVYFVRQLKGFRRASC